MPATDEGWLYLATVIDIASCHVVSWGTADHLRIAVVADALTAACRTPLPAGLTRRDIADRFRGLADQEEARTESGQPVPVDAVSRMTFSRSRLDRLYKGNSSLPSLRFVHMFLEMTSTPAVWRFPVSNSPATERSSPGPVLEKHTLLVPSSLDRAWFHTGRGGLGVHSRLNLLDRPLLDRPLDDRPLDDPAVPDALRACWPTRHPRAERSCRTWSGWRATA